MEYYNLLQVSKTASSDEIKISFKKLAAQYHPDRNPGNDTAAAQFKSINEAYQVLSNFTKRSEYDRKGYVGRYRPSSPPPKQQKPPEKPKPKPKPEPEKKNEPFNQPNEPNEIECTFFGSSTHGRSILVHVHLTQEELNNGVTKSFWIKKRHSCSLCGGLKKGLFPCMVCRNNPIQKYVCSYCDTSGEFYQNCIKCKGDGYQGWMAEQLSYKFPANAKLGDQYTILGMGEDAFGKDPGNVRLIVV